MTLEEYFKSKNLSFNNSNGSVYQPGMTFAQYEQAIKMRPIQQLFKSTNNLISDFNNRAVNKYDEYGDYSSDLSQYSYFKFRADELLKNLDTYKDFISETDYKNISDKLNSIASASDTQKKNVQGIIDFYSSFEDENQYKSWETDNRLYAEHGDLTAENVDYYIRSMEKRKAKGELNGYEEEFYNWIKNYDLTHGYKDEAYFNQRIATLEEAKRAWQDKLGMVYDTRGTTSLRYKESINEKVQDIEGRIGDMKSLRYQIDRENVYEAKGYNLHKGAVGFEDKAKAYEASSATPLPADGSKDRIRTKNVKDKVVFAYQNKDVFFESFFDSGIGWSEYTLNPEEANKIQEQWKKYTYLTPDEYSTYCYLKEMDKQHGTESAEKFISDMEPTLDMRETTGADKKIREDMNAGGFKGGFATGFYNVLSVPASVLGGVRALPSAAVSLIKGEDINIYSESFALSNFASTVRATTSDMIDSPGWNLVYNAVMSTADSLLAAVAFRGAAPYILAASAATSRMKELVQQGASDVEIVIGSLASGLIEVVTEKISIDRLFGGDIKPTTVKQFFAEGLKQSLTEGSEEVASEVLNNLSDEMLRGSMSDYNQSIRRYQAQGLSKSEAQKKAANDMLVQIAEAALSGMISGGIGGLVSGGSQMHKFNVIGSNIIKGGNVDTVLTAAEYMGSLDPEIAGQVQALNKYKETAKSGKANTAYKRMLGKVAATVSQNVTEVKQSVTEKAVSSELKSRGIDSKVVGKVSKIVGKFLSGQKLSSSEQGYLQHNSVASTVMQEIELAQEQVKAGATPSGEGYTSSASQSSAPSPQGEGFDASSQSGSAPQWAVDLVNKLTTIDSAMSVIKLSAGGKAVENTGNNEVNRMIKILSIASGKTTAEQEAEAGDIPYSQYIKEKEAAEKENTAENSGEVVEKTIIEDGIKYSIKYPAFTEDDMIDNAIELQNMEPVKELTGKEFPKSDVPLQQRVLDFFDSLGNNVHSELLGDVALTNSSVRDDLGHGRTNNKIISFAAIPEVIQQGVVIDSQRRGNNSYDRIVVAAPIKIGTEEFVMGVMLQRGHQNQRLYLHDVVSLNKEETAQDSETTPSTTEVSEKSNSLYMTSILQRALAVKKDYMQGEEKNTSIDDFTGFNEPDVSEDGVTYESRLLHTMRGEKITTEGQAYIKKICKNLGIDVVFENVFTPKGKHADGYIDSDGVIHIDYRCSKPVEFVLKHELTHYGESSALYSNFCKAVISSEAFAQWINEKVEGDGNATVKAAEYREQIARLYEKNGVRLSPAKQQNEMIANFVGEVLFSADTNGLERLTTNMPIKQKRSVIDFIKDFIAHIKEKLTKVNGVSSEILGLERKFNKLLSSAEQNKTADEGGVKYSFGVTQQDIDNYVDAAYVKENTEDYKKYAEVSEKLINEVATEIDITGYSHALRDNDIRHIRNSHGENTNEKYPVTKEDIKNIPEIVENYDKVFVKTNSSRGLGLLYVKVMPDNVVYYVEAITTVYGNEPLLINKQMVKTGIEEIPNLAGYKEAITKKESETEFLTELKAFREAYAQSVYQSHSTDIIDDNSSSVNSNSMQETGDYSIPTDTVEDTSSTEAAKKEDVNKAYINSVDEKIVDFVEDARQETNKKRLEWMHHKFNNDMPTAIKNKIRSLVGFDISGFSILLNGEAVHHIDRRHGKKGKHDNSMQDDNDIARMQYIISNADDAEYTIDSSGSQVFDSQYRNSNNTKSHLVTLSKKINGYYYVILAVPDSNNKTMHVKSAYISKKIKKEDSQEFDAKAPNTTSETNLDISSKYSVPDISDNVNKKYSIDLETPKESDTISFPDQMRAIDERYRNGELTDEEYRIEAQNLLLRANEKFGTIEQGEKAENKTLIPKRVTSDKSKKTKRWVRTVHESGILPEDMEVELDRQILENLQSYQIIGDKEAQRQANLAIERGTAVREWEAAINGDGLVSKRTIAIGETLLKLAAERKDSRTVMKLICEVSEMGTRAGQIVQAMSMLKKLDGIGQLYYVQKCVERINRDLDKRFARKLKKGKLDSIPQVKINETLANQLAASKTKEDFDVTYEAMMQSIADQVPTTFLDKWNAWRYFAMLFNSRTHIRNFGGNLSNLPTVRFKDLLAASIEKIFLDEEQRTKSAIVKKEYQKFAEEDYPEVEAIITGGGKMSPSDEIRDRQNVFDTKWLEKLRKWNFDMLEKEDAYFLKKHYAHALGGFLQARDIDISKDIDASVMEEARKYAMIEAQKATYRDASKAAAAISNFTSKGGFLGNFVEGVLPFKKTPINIVKRGIEYSPIGLIKTLTKGTVDLVNEKITASQYIDGIAGGLTGTGIVLLGMLLSSLGFIKITGGFDDDEEDDINRLLGRQEYAIEIAGHSYTIDWMAPVCIPFFMGVEIQKSLEEDGNGNLWQSIKNVAGNALEPVINLSMLSGIQDVISSAKYSEGSAVVGSALWSVALSYGFQAVPSIFGATARTIDGTRRTSYIDKTSWMSDMGQMALDKLESKLPFVSMLRSEYVDEFGRTEDSGNIFVRAIQNFVSPGYYSKIEDDPVIGQLQELYEETGESVLPSKPKKYITVGGENVHLTAEEYEEYAKEVGRERYDLVEEFFGSSDANNLTAEEKREVISNLYSYALAKGKTQYSKYELSKTYTKIYEAEKNGVSPVDYYVSKIVTNDDNADTNGDGSAKKNEKLAAIRRMNVSNDIKAALIALYS